MNDKRQGSQAVPEGVETTTLNVNDKRQGSQAVPEGVKTTTLNVNDKRQGSQAIVGRRGLNDNLKRER